MNSQFNTIAKVTPEDICRKLLMIILMDENLTPWERSEICIISDTLTDKQLTALSDFVSDRVPELIRKNRELEEAKSHFRWLEAWKDQYVFTNDIVSKLLDVKDLEEAHRRAKWLDEWKRKNDITVT
jgi:hypothetical protein